MIEINKKEYKEIRCYRCGRFIVYANISAGIMAFHCPRCGFLNEWTFKYYKSKENQDNIDLKYTLKEKGDE